MATPTEALERSAGTPRRHIGSVRWGIAVLLGAGIVINYFDRINLSVATKPLIAEFHLTPAQMGIVLSSFLWSYALLQIPIGTLLDRFGVTWLMRIGTILWTIATFLTAIASGLGFLLFARVILGIAEAPAFPGASKATSYWFPLGEDGQRLHEWYFKDNAAAYNKEIEADLANVDAVIIGRRTYENAHTAWGGNPGPLGSVPCIVLAHADHVAAKDDIGSAFTFVSDGIERALAKAQEMAGDKDIAIMGASVQQQFLVAGLLDEIHVDVVPVLLCEGVRLFDHLGSKHISLEQTEVSEGDQVAHLTYRVLKTQGHSKRSTP